MTANIPTEHMEQVYLFRWAKAMEAQYPELALMFAIPNMGNRHISFAMKMKAEGLKAGVPDIMLPVARGQFHGLFIELKRTKGGSVSATQREWLTELEAQDYRVAVCRGWEQAKDEIMNYLSHRKEA